MKTKLACVLFVVFVIFTFCGCPIWEELTTAYPPENVAVSEVYSDGVLLTWTAEGGMQSFVVYVSKTQNINEASSLSVESSNGGAQIFGLEPFTQYYFWVQSVVLFAQSELSEMVSARTLVGAPQKVDVEFDDSDINLTWDPVPNADDYLVYYGKESSVENASKKIFDRNTTTKSEKVTIKNAAVSDGTYYIWVFGRKDEKSSSYAATTSKLKGEIDYKFYFEDAPASSKYNYSLEENAEGTEVFLLKVNTDDKNSVLKNETGSVSKNTLDTKYPVYYVAGSRISRSSEFTTPLQEETSVVRVEHKLSKEINFTPQKNLNPIQSRSVNSIQNRSDDYTYYKVGDKKSFWIDNENGKFSEKTATLITEGKYSYVWVLDNVYSKYSEDRTDNKISQVQAGAVADKFDQIYGPETTIFGKTYKTFYQAYNEEWGDDEDFIPLEDEGLIVPEKKVSILICDIYDDYSPVQSSGVLGYFWMKDFFADEFVYEGSEYTIRSNETEIFYIDSHFLDSFTEMTYSTLAHEFQHMLNFVNKNLWWNLGGEENPAPSTWYNEMLSMVCEDLLQDVIGIEDKDSPRSRLAQFNYGYILNGANEWFNDENTLYSYAHAYAFGAFVTRNYGGAELVQEIMLNDSVDFTSILAAINELNNLSLTKEELLAEFARALCYPEEIKGEEDDITTQLGKAYYLGLKHFYRTNTCKIESENRKTYTYTLRPIRLADYHFGFHDENGKVQYKFSPYYLDADKTYDLRPLGISVHSLGVQSGKVTFDYTKPSSSSVKTYFVIQ